MIERLANRIATARCSAGHRSLAIALLSVGSAQVAQAQETPAKPTPEQAATTAGSSAAASVEEARIDEILVTGSRIQRAGFDAPTPTTVVGQTELRLGNRQSIAAVLNDLPQFRATSSPQATTANTGNSASPVDLRSLGVNRTLTLLNGRRFIGAIDLNSIPSAIVERIEVVTGGASAAWGSGAVAGVVNIIIDDDLQGVTLGAENGLSSRADAFRYGFKGSYGTRFAGDKAHVMVAAEYLREEGAFGRNSGNRRNLDSGLFTSTSGQLSLQNDVNNINATPGGVIRSGVLANQAFNPDGTLGPVPLGRLTNATQTVGGNSRGQLDSVAVTSPYERFNVFARLSYEFSPAAKLWVDANWMRIQSDFPFFPEVVTASATAGITLSKDNAFLSPAVRAQLASGPQTFTLGRILGDVGPDRFLAYEYQRDLVEGGIGIDGSFGHSWTYSIYYNHGQNTANDLLKNQRKTANFTQAIDAVVSPTTGQPVCRVALTDPSTACRPINLFGEGNVSNAGFAFAFGDAGTRTRVELDAFGATLRGDPFSLWAGPVGIAIGVEARTERQSVQADPLSLARTFSLVNFADLSGSFNVKEAFGEVLLPLLDIEGAAKLDFNGSARYSDYSNSGGIWSWKTGATLRLFDDLLLRAVVSRDIRSPSVAELFTQRLTNIQNVSDPFNNNQVVSVTRFGGGNPDLTPETARTMTFGGTYSPRFAPGLRLSVDYFDIKIDNVIGSLSAQDVVTQCFRGNEALCNATVRDSNGALTTVFATNLNLAQYQTQGIDFEAAYRVSLKNGDTLQFRGLATYVDKLLINDGVNTYDRAGDVGEVAFSTPKWRANASVNYTTENAAFDLRVRYVDGGNFNSLLPIVNNRFSSRTYVDIGARTNIAGFTIFGTINNLFDRDPPFVTYNNQNYDLIGRYYSLGVSVKF